MDKHQAGKFLKTHSSALSVLVSAIINIIAGLVIIFRKDFFTGSVSALLLIYFTLMTLLNFFQAIFSITKGIKQILTEIFETTVSFCLLVFVAGHLAMIFSLIPLIMSIWAILVGFSKLISFLQYRNEKSTAPFRYFLASILNFGFGISFITNLVGAVPTSLNVLGCYILLLGITSFLDALTAMTPSKYKAKLKSHVRITPPPYLTALIPVKIVAFLNEYLGENAPKDILKAVSNDDEANVEVFVHVSPDGLGAMGHVDIAIENRVVSFGGYDEASMKLGGGIGPGVLFEHFEKEKYIKFCQQTSNKTIFGFGLVLTKDEIAKMIDELNKLKSRTYIWKCDAERALEENRDPSVYKDYGSLLYLATKATFYKFKGGSFKYYWVLGTNCVKLSDTLLSASGMPTLANGIITPGTYYEYLDRQFTNANTRVITRTVYHPTNKK